MQTNTQSTEGLDPQPTTGEASLDAAACSAFDDLRADIRNKLTPALTLATIAQDGENAELGKLVESNVEYICDLLNNFEQNANCPSTGATE